MILTRKKTCNECPFRKKSIQGWLGPWKTAQSLLKQVHGEGGLPCHKSYDPLLKKGMDMFDALDQAHVCVGSLQHANQSCKVYMADDLYAMQQEVGTSKDALTYNEFLEHHK